MIKKVEIENFKKFKKTSVNLKPDVLSIVVGGNNSGKSSLLQALALWNYAKSFIIFFKQRDALSQLSKKDGVGISFDDFTPLNIPSFEYLWTNLSATGGYTMKIKVIWNNSNHEEKYLQIGFSLVQDRLYARKMESNLTNDDYIPEIAYLPPFAGITEKEPWLSNADRRKQIGRGLSGSVLRNLIYDYFNSYSSKIINVKTLPKKKQALEKREIFNSSDFGRINNILAAVFSVQLFPEDFSQEFHNYLRVPLKKGEWQNNLFEPYKNYSARDIMSEGRGFLQWLNTLCLLYDKKIDVLLLDEPDAHLHATLQIELIRYLNGYLEENNKQILIATHSSEVIKSVDPSIILSVGNNKANYCVTESQIQNILLGIGVEHFPMLHKIQQSKKIVFVENNFDAVILKNFAQKLAIDIPNGVVFWPMANNHKERKNVFLHLKDQIKGISVISLEDKDNIEYSTTSDSLADKQFPDYTEEKQNNIFLARRWRRWELENYLISPAALAKACSTSEEEIQNHLETNFSIIWPNDHKISTRSNTNAPLFDRDGKTIIESFEIKYKINKQELPNYFVAEDIPDDIKTILSQIKNM